MLRRHRRIGDKIADAFAGQGKRLGKRSEHAGPLGERQRGRDDGAVKGEGSIGFVGQEEERTQSRIVKPTGVFGVT